MNQRMAFQPTIVFRLVRVEIVQHNMNFATRMLGHNFIHEIQELTPSPRL